MDDFSAMIVDEELKTPDQGPVKLLWWLKVLLARLGHAIAAVGGHAKLVAPTTTRIEQRLEGNKRQGKLVLLNIDDRFVEIHMENHGGKMASSEPRGRRVPVPRRRFTPINQVKRL